AVARYGGLTGSPDESGKARRGKGLARAGNARVRKGVIQLAWRFLDYQKERALAKWVRARTENARGSRKKVIVAWRASCSSPCGTSSAMASCPRASFSVRHTEGRTRSRYTRRFRPCPHKLAIGRR